jgi:hypothetical protein
MATSAKCLRHHDRGFAQMLASDEAPDPQLVVDAYLSLADAAPGKRPTRTVVGITWGVDEVNAFTQPRQDALLKNAARHRARRCRRLTHIPNEPLPLKKEPTMKKTLTLPQPRPLSLATGALADDTTRPTSRNCRRVSRRCSCKATSTRCEEVANADYIQHNPFIPTGLEPLHRVSAGCSKPRIHG